MFKVLTLNNISDKGLSRLPADQYAVADDTQDPDAIILRSYKMHDMDIPASVKAIGRAGAGVNNIPVDKMSEQGIPVFNAPGANANAVKELVIVGMLLAARNICDAWDYTRNLNEPEDDKLNKEVEAGKKKFAGYELPGRTLAVIGLGAIGVRVANAAEALGMNVIGYDPVITVENAWRLSAGVKKAATVEEALNAADFVTFHVPLIEPTRNMLNAERLADMKDGVVVMNLARGGIVDDAAVLDGLASGKVSRYVSDFPSNQLQGKEGVIALPHLGASTGEAEENCAIMVAEQVKDYLENGNIVNSVNFPQVQLPRAGEQRLAVSNLNRPDMVGQISHVLGDAGLNIFHMVNESRGDVAYTLVDIDSQADDSVIEKLSAIDGVLNVRAL
ncbi:D-3-phosphoglycerate dehydrogenase [gamma proteobacterium HTCC5015]|nr:D-3-phosphoglycerate dehydrogenase [gamma proteobacterium HTCC5015]